MNKCLKCLKKPNSNVQYSNNFDSKPPNNVEFSDNKKETENLPDTKMVYDNIMQQRKYEDEQLYTTQKKGQRRSYVVVKPTWR